MPGRCLSARRFYRGLRCDRSNILYTGRFFLFPYISSLFTFRATQSTIERFATWETKKITAEPTRLSEFSEKLTAVAQSHEISNTGAEVWNIESVNIESLKEKGAL